MNRLPGSKGKPPTEDSPSPWKQSVTRTLTELGLVGSTFTGRIVFNFNSGAISDMEKVERIK